MSEDEVKEARRSGEEMGRVKTKVDAHERRIGRLEGGILAVIGAIVAAWAKTRGLW